MGNREINRFCELVVEINELNKRLKLEKHRFYDGGTSFEEGYKADINVLENLQNELEAILINLT